jgi:hypothetical protein
MLDVYGIGHADQLTAVAGSSREGATFSTVYHDRLLEGVPVTLDELHDFKKSSIEEFWQFAFGEFLVVGAFWLGVERAFTVQNLSDDTLFLFCMIAFVAGSIIGCFGLRQLQRRKARIDRLIQAAGARRLSSAST